MIVYFKVFRFQNRLFKMSIDAREYVRQKGLNPRDIHLKNIFLQNGRAKIIDVSEYVQPGNDLRWEYLKKAYDQYYHLIEGKPFRSN